MINNNEKKNKKKDITAKYDFNSGLKQSISKKKKNKNNNSWLYKTSNWVKKSFVQTEKDSCNYCLVATHVEKNSLFNCAKKANDVF